MREKATELKESIRGSKTRLDHRSFFITTDGVTLPTLRGAYASTRVRRVASDHFRDRSTASSSSSSPILFPSVFFLFSFSNKREDKIGENFAYTFHTNRGTTSRYIIQDVVSQKLETTSQVFPKCFTFPIPFFPCLLSHSFLA